jgi:hypothetical protein
MSASLNAFQDPQEPAGRNVFGNVTFPCWDDVVTFDRPGSRNCSGRGFQIWGPGPEFTNSLGRPEESMRSNQDCSGPQGERVEAVLNAFAVAAAQRQPRPANEDGFVIAARAYLERTDAIEIDDGRPVNAKKRSFASSASRFDRLRRTTWVTVFSRSRMLHLGIRVRSLSRRHDARQQNARAGDLCRI